MTEPFNKNLFLSTADQIFHYLEKDDVTGFYTDYAVDHHPWTDLEINVIKALLWQTQRIQDTEKRHRRYAFFRPLLSRYPSIYRPLLNGLRKSLPREKSKIDLHILEDVWQIH